MRSTDKHVLSFDTRDDKRVIHELLEWLSPAWRVRFLRWACTQCTFPDSDRNPGVQPGHTGTALECFFDLFVLAREYGLDLDRTLKVLRDVVRRHGHRPRHTIDSGGGFG